MPETNDQQTSDRETSDERAVLAVNAGFYHAIVARDYAAMSRIWAGQAPVTCAHPGWPPLLGRAAVMESWAGILGNPEAPRIRCLEPKATLHGRLALVLCYEVIGQDVLVASNLYVKEAETWKMVHHQAGPTIARPAAAAEPISKRLH
jgi:hypothetical protein